MVANGAWIDWLFELVHDWLGFMEVEEDEEDEDDIEDVNEAEFMICCCAINFWFSKESLWACCLHFCSSIKESTLLLLL